MFRSGNFAEWYYLVRPASSTVQVPFKEHMKFKFQVWLPYKQWTSGLPMESDKYVASNDNKQITNIRFN